MKPTRLWIGLVFLGFGVFGILDATGALEWNNTIGRWWPIAIIGFGLADMLADHRFTLGGIVITGIGVALLIEEQGWTGEDAVWSVLLLMIGAAILLGHRKDDARKPSVGSPSIKSSEHALR